MSVELTSYMSQYAALTAEITSSISKIGRLNSEISESTDIDGVTEQNGKLMNITGQVDKSFEDVEELFEQMELEIRELVDQVERTKHTTNLQSFKVEWTRLKKEFEFAKKRRNRNSAKDNNMHNGLKPEASVRRNFYIPLVMKMTLFFQAVLLIPMQNKNYWIILKHLKELVENWNTEKQC